MSKSIDYKIKSKLHCPKCRSKMRYNGIHTVVCKKCNLIRGGFDHIHFITKRLAIGNGSVPCDTTILDMLGITGILTVAKDFSAAIHPKFMVASDPKYGYYREDLSDSGDNERHVFLGAVQCLSNLYAWHGRILCHCMGGGRRSVGVVSYFLNGDNPEAYWKTVVDFKKVRQCIPLEGDFHNFVFSEVMGSDFRTDTN